MFSIAPPTDDDPPVPAAVASVQDALAAIAYSTAGPLEAFTEGTEGLKSGQLRGFLDAFKAAHTALAEILAHVHGPCWWDTDRLISAALTGYETISVTLEELARTAPYEVRTAYRVSQTREPGPDVCRLRCALCTTPHRCLPPGVGLAYEWEWDAQGRLALTLMLTRDDLAEPLARRAGVPNTHHAIVTTTAELAAQAGLHEREDGQ